jgi:predicted nucleic acid-binding protein
MSPFRFYDSNILLYATSTDPSEAGKQVLARTLLADDDWGLSAQVLSEFYVNVTRAKKSQTAALTPAQAREFVSGLLQNRQCQGISGEMIVEATALATRYQIQFWDAVILIAAMQLGCGVVLSEDMSHGQHYGSVQVINPFLNLSH